MRSTRGEGQTNQLRDRKVTSRQQNDQHSKCSSRVRHGQEQVCCSVTDMRQPVSSTELIGQLTRAIQSLSNQLPTARHSSLSLSHQGSSPLEEAPDRGLLGPHRVSSAPQIQQIQQRSLQVHFLFSSNRHSTSPRAIGRRKTPVEDPGSLERRLIIGCYY